MVQCPRCNCQDSFVTHTRTHSKTHKIKSDKPATREVLMTRRRRQCRHCGYIYWTREVVESETQMVHEEDEHSELS